MGAPVVAELDETRDGRGQSSLCASQGSAPLPSSHPMPSPTSLPHLPRCVEAWGLGPAVQERSLQDDVQLGSRGANRTWQQGKNTGFGVRRREFNSWLCSNLVERCSAVPAHPQASSSPSAKRGVA